MSKLVVLVIGATGYVGSATVQVLVEKYGSKVEIRAGVRKSRQSRQAQGYFRRQRCEGTNGYNRAEEYAKGRR